MKQHLSLSVESLYPPEFVSPQPNFCSHVASNNSKTTQIILKPKQQKIY